eukprot:SAG31_NODE_3200_length_4562_cov_7.550955_3_plen_139_part_00
MQLPSKLISLSSLVYCICVTHLLVLWLLIQSAVQTELVATQGKIDAVDANIRNTEATLRAEIASAASSVAASSATSLGQVRTDVEQMFTAEIASMKEASCDHQLVLVQIVLPAQNDYKRCICRTTRSWKRASVRLIRL